MVRDKGKGCYRPSSLARSQGKQGGASCSSLEDPSGPPVALFPGQAAPVVLEAKDYDRKAASPKPLAAREETQKKVSDIDGMLKALEDNTKSTGSARSKDEAMSCVAEDGSSDEARVESLRGKQYQSRKAKRDAEKQIGQVMRETGK